MTNILPIIKTTLAITAILALSMLGVCLVPFTKEKI